jgi:hypothetical protein
MYSPYDRGVVSNVGVGRGVRYNYNELGEVDGLFNIGKMFTRMFTFTPKSFTLKNIAGAIGSVTTTIASGGLVAFAPKIQSAHSDVSKIVGYGTMAAAAGAGLYFGGSALLSSVGGGAGAGALTTAGSVGTASSGSSTIGAVLGTGSVAESTWTVGGVLSSIGSGIGTGLKALTSILPVMGMMGGGGGQQQQGGMTQAEYDAQQKAAYDAGQQQAAYNAQVAAQQQQMYQPGAMPVSYDMSQPTMNTSYGDLRSPYTAIAEDGSTVQVDPNTGQVIQPGLSTPMMIGIGGVVLLAGWYFMSGSKVSN